ncbi:unnamed protein product [Arctogadus glacialis]
MSDLMLRFGFREDFMDWWTLLVVVIALLIWILCFIDGNAVHELRLLFQALTKATCHLYLAILQLRRAASHIIRGASNFLNSAQQQPPPYSPKGNTKHRAHHQPHWRRGLLHYIEAMCLVCETVPNLTCAVLLSLGEALSHALQVFFCVLAAPLRSIQAFLFSQMNGEKERWDKERHRAKETEKNMNSKVLEYISLCGQDPFTALRRVAVPPR